MNIQKLETSIMFTPYTIDTYQTFTLECEESILDGMNDSNGVQLTYEDLEWTYEHKGYVQALTENWLVLMRGNIIDDVILAVDLIGEAYSPREYNFSTDDCAVVFTVDIDALKKYIGDNKEAYDKDHIRDSSGFWWFGNENDTMLHYYLHTQTVKGYTPDDYIMDQREDVQEYDYVDYKILKK